VVELAERFDLTPEAAAKLDRFRSLLAGDPRAPTAVRDHQAILDDHLADSLVALDVESLRMARRVADIGSGPGVPGLPLAVALPGAEFVLVESASRKCLFIQQAIASCGIPNAAVAHSRVESWVQRGPDFDVVTCRAVAALEVVVEYAAPLLRLGGQLIVWRGRRDLQAEERSSRAADLLGLRPEGIRHVRPYVAARDRYLHLFSKVRDTPPEFPRRAGVAARRPLGQS
jgi:16S rRNA (guanine527-N7)-methyltransferase